MTTFSKDRTENFVFISCRQVQEKVRNLFIIMEIINDKPSLDEIEYNWNDSIRSYKSTLQFD